MTTIFIDTGALIARFIANDDLHQESLRIWELIEKQQFSCLTTNHVLDETFTLLARRVSYAFSAQKARLIYESQVFTVVRPGEKEELQALSYFEKYADQRVSFTDCLSFAVMKEMRVMTAFSFDRHFSQVGFERCA